MRYLPTKKAIRGLFAAEGYLELELPGRALKELDRIEQAGELEPYREYLKGQALQQLDRYEEAIDSLQKAARSLPAPFNGKVWEDLSECFRHEGLQELADVAELFAEDPSGGADCDFSECSESDFLTDFGSEFSFAEEDHDPWNRSPIVSANDFDQYSFEESPDEFGMDFDGNPGDDSRSPHHKRPRK
jgi:tetratricopeptide (TPR) repeat protein